MLLRAAHNNCEDHLRFLEEDKKFNVRDFVESYVVAVMVKLEVLPEYARWKPLRLNEPQKGVMDDIEMDLADKHAIFKLIKQLTEDYCYSWEQYKLLKRDVSFRSKCKLFPPDQVETLVNDDGFLNSLTEAVQMCVAIICILISDEKHRL